MVGIDDIQFASYTNPGLTTVAQPKHELGALAVDALLARASQADGEAATRTTPARTLDGQLVIRESTAPAAPAAQREPQPHIPAPAPVPAPGPAGPDGSANELARGQKPAGRVRGEKPARRAR